MTNKLYIAHRGNLAGAIPKFENSPDYIDEAITKGFDVEIDIQYKHGNQWFLGHNEPQYAVDLEWLDNRKKVLWLHLKTPEAVADMMEFVRGWRDFGDYNFFSHDKDDRIITSQGYIWVNVGRPIVGERNICVLPEQVQGWDITGAAGICSDFIEEYK